MSHSTFILDLLYEREPTSSHKFKYKLVKMFNRFDFGLKLTFKEDELNRLFEIRERRYENLLDDACMNVEKANNIHLLLSHVLWQDVPGDVVELGCYNGTSTQIIRETMNQNSSNKELHVYDSFDGLPEKDPNDGETGFQRNQLRTNKNILINAFNKRGLQLPVIHEGWFCDTLPEQLPASISFAHLDGDFYTSIMDSLVYVYPKLTRGAVAVIDDYCDPEVLGVHNILPGVKKACDEFFSDKPEKMNVLLSGGQSQGYFLKK